LSPCLVAAGLEFFNLYILTFYVFFNVVSPFFGMRGLEPGPPTKGFTLVIAGEKSALRVAK
jgi:hypothetical protein